MKKTVIFYLLYLITIANLISQDNSTPIDGNLYIKTSVPFVGDKINTYNDDEVLLKRGLTYKNNRIYIEKNNKIYNTKNRTRDSDVTWIDDNTFVVLTGNSDRYSHGILGDTNESTGFEIFRDNMLISKYRLPTNQVFETLRPLVADIIPENEGKEILLTSSNSKDGAKVEIYSISGKLLGSSDPIGKGYRWLHLLGVFPNKSKSYVGVVKTPHINGILELLYWNGKKLITEVSFSGVSSHQIGSDNLNMALIINYDESKTPTFIIPSANYRKLLFLEIIDGEINIQKQIKLNDRISTNILLNDTTKPSIWFGLSNGQFIEILE